MDAKTQTLIDKLAAAAYNENVCLANYHIHVHTPVNQKLPSTILTPYGEFCLVRDDNLAGGTAALIWKHAIPRWAQPLPLPQWMPQPKSELMKQGEELAHIAEMLIEAGLTNHQVHVLLQTLVGKE